MWANARVDDQGGTVMRSIWKRRWMIVAVAVAVILAVGAVGAVAVAGPGDEMVALADPTTATTGVQAPAGVQPPAGDQPGPGVWGKYRERLRDRVHDRMERIKERWTEARKSMSPADQATFDQLTQKAKDQRAQLEKDAQALRETLGQMRDLVQKSRALGTTTTTAPRGEVQ
jgi:hypothetical protein